MRLLLVRHGQTSSNVGHHLDTRAPGADLTDLGRAQAAAVPEALAAEDISAVYVSDLVRTQQTAAPLATSLGVAATERGGIREVSAGDVEMRNDAEAVDVYVETVFGWEVDPDKRIPGGESGAEVLGRFDEVVTDAYRDHPDGTVVMFSHGAVIRWWAAARADNVDIAYAAAHWLPNTGMVALEGGPDSGWTVVSWTPTPLGGVALADPANVGPTGEPEDQAVESAEQPD